jgi:hypothetical protein
VELEVPWYLWIDLPRRVLELYRLVEGRYELVAPDEQGRVWCPELNVGFAWDASERLVRVLSRDGSIVLTADEEAELREEAEERATREAQQRAAAEQRAEAAEQAAAAERERAASLAAELERLRRALRDSGDVGDTDQS